MKGKERGPDTFKMIKAGSLMYAIYIVLIIALLSSGLLYVFTVNRSLSDRYNVQGDLVTRCASCIDYFLSKKVNLASYGVEALSLFEDDYRCVLQHKKWGLYSSLSVKAYFKKDTIGKNVLIGEVRRSEAPALYLGDFGEALKISGTTVISGMVKLPKRGYEKVNILGNQQRNDPRINGAVLTSAQELPRLKFSELNADLDDRILSLEELQEAHLDFNGFDQKTITVVLDQETSLEGIALKGNFIVRSRDTLRIPNSAKLEDVIIQAPKIVVEKKFEGSVQLFASKAVIVEEEVVLEYPSCVVVYSSNNQDLEKIIELGARSAIYGGVVMDARSYPERQHNSLIVGEEARLVGDVYCDGMLEFKGKSIGSVYAHKLQLTTDYSLYSDVLLNATMDAKSLPESLVRLFLFNEDQNNTFGIVKDL